MKVSEGTNRGKMSYCFSSSSPSSSRFNVMNGGIDALGLNLALLNFDQLVGRWQRGFSFSFSIAIVGRVCDLDLLE